MRIKSAVILIYCNPFGMEKSVLPHYIMCGPEGLVSFFRLESGKNARIMSTHLFVCVSYRKRRVNYTFRYTIQSTRNN